MRFIFSKLTDTPPAWADKFLQVRVFAWDEKAKAWEADPVAVSDRVVFGKGKLWQHNLTLLGQTQVLYCGIAHFASTWS